MRRALIAAPIMAACALVATAQQIDNVAPTHKPRESVAAFATPRLLSPEPALTGRTSEDASAAKPKPEPAAAKPAVALPTTTAEPAHSNDTATTAAKNDEAGEDASDTNAATTEKGSSAETDASSAANQTAPDTPKVPIAARSIFGALATPAAMDPRALGFYSRGCLAGGVALPIDGEVWQAMRLSRNRNWGHPKLITVVKRLAEDVATKDGWSGLLVGDLSQPRGGPMLSGHSSHQVGLDADIWLTPMPAHKMTYKEREALSATSMLGPDGVHADPKVFTPYHAALIRRAASYPEVERIFIHPGIKKAMCEETGVNRKDFHKIRPYWGHHYHMHIRIGCPDGNAACRTQAPTGNDDGCGKEVDHWIALMKRPAKPEPPVAQAKPVPTRRLITLDDLPQECKSVVDADEVVVGKTAASNPPKSKVEPERR